MFEYCRGRHVDPAYPYFGTVDYGIHDLDTGTVLFYSDIKTGGVLPFNFHIIGPLKFDEFIQVNQVKGSNLAELFEQSRKLQEFEMDVECVQGDAAEIRSHISKDLESIPPEFHPMIESALAEAF